MRIVLSLFLYVFLLVEVACQSGEHHNNGSKLIDCGSFTMRVPQNWKPFMFHCIDCFAVGFQAGKDTIASFDYGRFCDPLIEDREYKHFEIEEGNVYVPDTTVKHSVPRHDHWVYFGKADSSTLEKVRWNKVTWTSIDQYKAKVVIPKKVGKGPTGVYIDSLWAAGSSKEQIVLSGNDLSLMHQQQLLQVIKSLKFYKDQELHAPQEYKL